MKEFLDTIKESFVLLDLEEDWDDDGANKVDPKAFVISQKILFSILSDYETELIPPEINPLRSGGIDISWRNESDKYRLLICVHAKKVSWYGDDGNDENHVKGVCDDWTFFHPENKQSLFNWIVAHFQK